MRDSYREMTDRAFCATCGASTIEDIEKIDRAGKSVCDRCVSHNVTAIRIFLILGALSIILSVLLNQHVNKVYADQPYPWFEIVFIAAILVLLATNYGKKYVIWICDASIVMMNISLTQFLIVVRAGPDNFSYHYYYMFLFILFVLNLSFLRTVIHSMILLGSSGLVMFFLWRTTGVSQLFLINYRIILLIGIIALLFVKYYDRKSIAERRQVERENLRNDVLRSIVMKSILSVNDLMIQQRDFQSTLNQIGKIAKTLTGARHIWLYITRKPEQAPDIHHLDPDPEVEKIAADIGFRSGMIAIDTESCRKRYDAWEEQDIYVARGMQQYCEGQFCKASCDKFQGVLAGKIFVSIPFMKQFEQKTYHAALTFVFDEEDYDLFVLKLFVNSFGTTILLNQIREERIQAFKRLERAHTELKETQSRLIALEKSAQIASIAAGVSHDINNPLGALQASVDVVEKSSLKLKSELDVTDESKKIIEIIDSALHVIKNATERISGVVRALRSFSHLDRARISLADINEAVENVILLLQPLILGRVKIQKDLEPLPRVKCNFQEINQVAMNLLLNAIEATPQGGVIDVRTRANGDLVTLQVADSGSGIPRETGVKIFNAMFSTKENHAGTGLTIARDIVDRHGGRIAYRSESGRGSVFTVELPRSGGPTAPGQQM
jgi:signal transduction histidine kinase